LSVNASRSFYSPSSPFAGIFTARISSGRDRGVFKERTSGRNARLFSLPLYQPPFISTSVPINSATDLAAAEKLISIFQDTGVPVKNPMAEPAGGKAFHEFPLLSDFAPCSIPLPLFSSHVNSNGKRAGSFFSPARRLPPPLFLARRFSPWSFRFVRGRNEHRRRAVPRVLKAGDAARLRMLVHSSSRECATRVRAQGMIKET